MAGGLLLGLPIVLAILTALAAAPVAAGAADERVAPTAAGRFMQARLSIDEVGIDADWYLPAGNAAALLILQHGYTRDCANLRGTSMQLMEHGLMVLCLNAQMSGGNPLLADALAALLAAGLTAPDGQAVPRQIIVGGHSAGAAFAARVGWRLAQAAPGRLLGALFFDPVASGNFARFLLAISDAGSRPVLAISARPGGCNVQSNALPALRLVRRAALDAGHDGFVGVMLTDRSTHVDVEGSDTTAFAVRACGQGAPLPANTAALRRLASEWALVMAVGERETKGRAGGVAAPPWSLDAAAVPIE